MNVEKWILQVQLKKKEESMPIIWSLVPATESDALLLVDNQNSNFKHVNLSSGTVDVLYRSSDNYSLRNAAFVADAQNRMQTLLLVEMQPNAADKTMTYSLVVAELRNATWTSTQRTRQRAVRSQQRLDCEHLRSAHEQSAMRCVPVGVARCVFSDVSASGAQRGARSTRLHTSLLYVRRV